MNNAKKVFIKELRDLLRDKRVRSSAFFGPFTTVCLLLIVFGFLMDAVSKPSSQKVHIVSRPGEELLVKAFQKAGTKTIIVPNVEAGKKLIKDGTARVVLDPGANLSASLTGKPQHVDEYFDPAQEAAEVTKTYVQKTFDAVNQAATMVALKDAGINPQLAEPLRLDPHEVTQGSSSVNQMLIGLLPYIIILWAFYGGLGAVSDMVAGEKEKNTLETLLITPVARRDIAAGKLGALALLCAMSSLSSIVGLLLVYALHLKMTSTMFAKGLGISPLALGQTVLVLIPSVFLFASVLMAVSTWARNSRECQTRLTLISMIFLMPAMFSQFIGYTEYARATWIAAIPVLNSAMAVRQSFSGEFHPLFMAITIGENLVLGSIAVIYTIRLFNREEVLLRT